MSTVRKREGVTLTGVRGGVPPKGGKPTTLTAGPAPTLTEEEMLHDGEPVSVWNWNESINCPTPEHRGAGVHIERARRTTPGPIDGVRR